MKSATVAIIGRPSAGKSSLINALCGYKVSIVSTVPQTTRNRIRGIVNRDQGQLIFIDTPGLHNSDKAFNLRLKNVAMEGLAEADMVVYALDMGRAPGPEAYAIEEVVAKHKHKLVIIGTKSDLAQRSDGLARLSPQFDRVPQLEISVKPESNTDQFLATLYDKAPEGPPLYPEDYYTDQPPEFRIAEVIREAAMTRVGQELPHALYVDVADLEYREAQNLLWIRAFLVVERESQQGILVGKNAAKIKAIGTAARKQLLEIFSQKIHLDLRVKADPRWKSKDSLLDRLLY